jgi:hypothetical protein
MRSTGMTQRSNPRIASSPIFMRKQGIDTLSRSPARGGTAGMSAMGHNRKSAALTPMSEAGGKADIAA